MNVRLKHSLLIFVCASILTTGAALASAPAMTQAANRPTTGDTSSAPAAASDKSAAPATSVVMDLSSPLAAAKSLFHAISIGDRDGIRAALYAGDPAQVKLADSMADFIAANKRLGDAARAKFGKAGDPIGRGMLDPSDLSRLDKATVKTSGDTATVLVPEQSRPMTFRRQNGQWKLVVTDFAGSEPGAIERQTRLISMMAQAVNESAEEIEQGKYATPEAAINAIQSRLHGVMLAFTHPSTMPATTRAGERGRRE